MGVEERTNGTGREWVALSTYTQYSWREVTLCNGGFPSNHQVARAWVVSSFHTWNTSLVSLAILLMLNFFHRAICEGKWSIFWKIFENSQFVIDLLICMVHREIWLMSSHFDGPLISEGYQKKEHNSISHPDELRKQCNVGLWRVVKRPNGLVCVLHWFTEEGN